MIRRIRDTERALDSHALQVRFSENVQDIFHDLAEIARTSAQFDMETVSILETWSRDEPVKLHTVMTALPLIAEQMTQHAKATGNETVNDIWRALCTHLPENGYTVSESRAKARQR